MATEFRMELRRRVRTLWTEKGWQLQEQLKAAGRRILSDAYRKCAREVPATEFKKCLEQAAKPVVEEYRKIWGTA